MTGHSKAKKYKLLDEISVRVLTVNHFQNNYKLMFHIHDVSAFFFRPSDFDNAVICGRAATTGQKLIANYFDNQ